MSKSGKLNSSIARSIRKDLSMGIKSKELQKRYGVGQTTISEIKLNRRYKDIDQHEELEERQQIENDQYRTQQEAISLNNFE